MIWPRPIPLVGDATSAADRRSNPTEWAFSDAERDVLYRIVGARRDIRRFRPDPLDPQTLQRLLSAANAAPSVGHSQPWRFVLVAETDTRERAAVIAERERLRQADLLAEDSRRKMLDLQLHGIREAPLGIVVCCDRRAEPAGVLGRATFPDTDLWSCACAIENLWLAARAEGLGVGWVTLFPPEELARLACLPEGVETLGWLCVGWPDERPPMPSLERAAWSRRLGVDEIVLQERWPGVGPARPRSHVAIPTQAAVVEARDEIDLLLTPPGSLGALDRSLDRLKTLGITGIPVGALFLAAADHPVAAHGVSTYASDVTREVLEATIVGESLGAAAARASDLEFIAVDAGVEGPPVDGVVCCRPLETRGDLVHVDALSHTDVERLLDFGRELGATATAASLVAIGEVGIGNTTIAAALASALLEIDPVDSVGLGTGSDSETLDRKISVVRAALSRVRQTERGKRLGEPDVALACFGGPEVAVLTGVILGVASRGGAVVLDGFVTATSALCALRLEPGIAMHLIAGQQSRERGHRAILNELGLEPLLDLRIRAGEGVGAVLAVQLLRTALRMRDITGRVAATTRNTV